MKFYTNIKYVMILAFAATFISSCNDISEDDRFIELPEITKERVVLMEEFTGQLCVNCPAAHEVIANLLKQYPNNLVSVSIHGGGDAFSFSEETMPGVGLRSNEGQQYCDDYKIASLPAAVVNRNSGVLNSDAWAGAIREELKKPSSLSLTLEASLSEDSKKINVTTLIEAYANIKGNILLWVTENDITSIQLTPSGFDRDYVHNHVYRATINGHKGQPCELDIREQGTFTYDIDVKEFWNTDNLNIVAFVYNSDGVLQAAESEVLPFQ